MNELKIKIGRARKAAMPFLLSLFPQRGWRWVPGSSERFGPPRRWASYADYRAETGDGWVPLRPAERLTLPQPFFPLPEGFPDLANDECDWPEQGVAVIREARVLFNQGWVVGRGDRWLGEFHLHGNRPQSQIYHILKIKRPERLRGRTLNLCALWADGNFYHWMMDVATKAELYRQAFGGWDGVDRILMPSFESATSRLVLERLGLPEGKILRMKYYDQYVCDELHVPSLPVPVRACPPWAVDFHRKLLEPVEGDGTRRLSFFRRATREVENGAEIEAQLRAEGFVEAFQDIDRLRRQLASATHIVGVHGAALTNLVYGRSGARVLELLPSENPWRYFRTITASLGMDYAAVGGRSLRRRIHPYSANPNLNFTLDPDVFRAALAALLAK
jgi:Glycosyltransferase 61